MALNVEASELLEIFQWMTEKDSNLVCADEVKKKQVEQEMADIFLYLVRMADKLDINLEAVALEKIKLNAEKYPVEKSKGNSKKYNEL
jgi:NTP pyrophosphatase (non-canonical NTP hydrolase)